MEISHSMKHSLKKRIFRYVVIGLGVALFQLATFFLFFHILHLHYQLSTVITFFCTLIVSYIAQGALTFAAADGSVRAGHRVSAPLFFGNALIGLMLVTGVMFFGVEILHINEYVVQIMAIGVVALYNFFVFHVIFR